LRVGHWAFFRKLEHVNTPENLRAR